MHGIKMYEEREEREEIELWQIAEIKIRNWENYNFWKQFLNEVFESESESEEIEEIETDYLKQLKQSAPITWKHNINVEFCLRKYSRYKKVLWSLYRAIEQKPIEVIVKKERVKIGDTEKEIVKTEIIDNRKKFLEFLTKITGDSEEQYILLYYYAWSKELKKNAIKPHETLKDAQRKRKIRETKEKIVKMVQTGKKIEEIAKETGLSKSTVSRVVKKVKEKMREERNKKIKELRDMGLTLKEIATLVGVSVKTVQRVLKELK